MFIYTHTYIYICMYVYTYMYVCVYGCNSLIWDVDILYGKEQWQS